MYIVMIEHKVWDMETMSLELVTSYCIQPWLESRLQIRSTER